MSYVYWALLGMVSYSLVTLFVKLATRDGVFSSFVVLAIATPIVGVFALVLAVIRGDFSTVRLADMWSGSALWSYTAGIALFAAVASLFRALSLGPASAVVPIYGMFVVGGSILGMIFLEEALSLRKALGISLAAVSIVLLSR